MSYSKFYLTLLSVFLFFSLESCSNVTTKLNADIYIISYEDNAQSQRWAEYFYSHLSKRTNNNSFIILQRYGENEDKVSFKSKTVKNIYFYVAKDLKHDYIIKHDSKQLLLSIKDNRTALWMVYQLIENIASLDSRFDATDLSPSTINFNSTTMDFDFDYREPHFAPNLIPDFAPINGNHSVDVDWGIWGHNLSKIIRKDNNDEIYALINKKRDKSQFCFSSDEVFNQIRDHIINNFGEGKSQSLFFMIMPEDNLLVCTCSKCLEQGNTSKYSTPSILSLIHKLSKRFPNHFFFTTAYTTTMKPPKHEFPDNAGVFISTIDLPKGINLEGIKETELFNKNISSWKAKTSNIYIWDYASNFDDYLTPIPVLKSLQSQLKYFKQQGVKGVFLNASGYDYSPFDDVKTHVISALMKDVDVSIDEITAKYFKKHYPQNHELLYNYYINLEDNYYQKNKAYNIYGSMRNSMETYFDQSEFVLFYKALGQVIPKTSGEEKEKISKMYIALTYTRLQIAYCSGYNELGYSTRNNSTIEIKPEIWPMITRLKEHINYPDIENYKEHLGELSKYIKEWEDMLSRGAYTNELLDIPIELLSIPDKGFEDTKLLNDGIQGFSLDYHQGWYLSTNKDLELKISSTKIQNAKQINIRFLNMDKHKIYPPQRVDLIGDNGKIVSVLSDKFIKEGDISVCTIPVNLIGMESFIIKIIKRKANKSIIACDEIQVIN